MTPGISDALARFCIEELPSRLTPAVRAAARDALADACAVALAGSTVKPNEVLRRALLPGLETAGYLATVIGHDTPCWAPIAALCNGSSAHSIELDDLVREASVHAGAVVVPAALAAAEVAGCSGERFLTAIVAGFEAMTRVGSWCTPAALFERHFHPTGVTGAYGAAASVAVASGLDAEHLSRAFGIVSDLSTALMDFGHSGSWSKRLHAGWPAHAGLLACRMAAEGFQGTREIFTSPRGMLFAYTGRTEPAAAAVPEYGEALAIEGNAFKQYACCRFFHTAMDMLAAIRASERLKGADIDRVRIGLFRWGHNLAVPVEDKCHPATMIEAQFSMQYSAAALIQHGRASLPEFKDDVVADPQVVALAERIEVVHDPALDVDFPDRYASWVEVDTRDGRHFADRRRHTLGDAEHPLSRTQFREKFDVLSGMVLTSRRVELLWNAVETIEAARGVRHLAECLRAGVPQQRQSAGNPFGLVDLGVR